MISIFLVLLGLFSEIQRDMYEAGIFLPLPKFQRDVYEVGIFLPLPPLSKISKICMKKVSFFPTPFPKFQRDLYEEGIFLLSLSIFFFFAEVGDGTFVYILFCRGRSFFNLHYAHKLFIVLYQNSLTYYPINSTVLWFNKFNNNMG